MTRVIKPWQKRKHKFFSHKRLIIKGAFRCSFLLVITRIYAAMFTLKKHTFILPILFLFSVASNAQKTWFVDGYHGGIYGHYPLWQTQFMVDTLRKYSDWKINLEIEPVTWDTVAQKDAEGYKDFQQLFKDSAMASRIEFVNPAYAQSYLYTASGESMIRQFTYGIKKIKEHFPGATFTTYSSEEPCFTSALPQVLKSFGFKYVVLKNPNTCWGGYTKNHGNEIVNWIGPDGTAIKMVPRYATEDLEQNSTWQTTAWNGSEAYYKKAIASGIKHPVAMCLQDAGWRNGRWLGANKQQAVYTTWRNYFEQVADTLHAEDWRVSQEDIMVSLVWGSQVLQQIAQEVRVAENKIIIAEKIAAMASLENGQAWPSAPIDDAWRTLLLSQHHDCWIVPYNGKKGATWADKVKLWTNNTDRISDSIIKASITTTNDSETDGITVYNTMGIWRSEFVVAKLPANLLTAYFLSVGDNNQKIPAQIISSKDGEKLVTFRASVPPLGYKYFLFDAFAVTAKNTAQIHVDKSGSIVMETDQYRLVIDTDRGGQITSLIAKLIDNKEFVDATGSNSFNTLRGNFYREDSLLRSSVNKATAAIIENGPLQIKLLVTNKIGSYTYTQTITMRQGEPRIDFNIGIDWQSSPGIGENYKQEGGYQSTDLHKAFYNDSSKLLITFPLKLENQQVFVDAPFDVTKSTMKHTFFNQWDSIKNNTMLGWVDVADNDSKYGFALLTDHTTNYVHGKDFPLSLVLQYAGVGLWGRDYSINRPTSVSYSIIPHRGNWQRAQLSTASQKRNEPLVVTANTKAKYKEKSFINCGNRGWQVSSFTCEDDHYLLRLFNAEAEAKKYSLTFGFGVKKVVSVKLNGDEINEIKIQKPENEIFLAIPQKGFVTLKLYK